MGINNSYQLTALLQSHSGIRSDMVYLLRKSIQLLEKWSLDLLNCSNAACSTLGQGELGKPQGLLLLSSLSSWPQPCVSRRVRYLGNWVDPSGLEPPWEWQAPEDPGEQATAHKFKKTPEDPASPIGFPHRESICKGVSQKWSGLTGVVIHLPRPPAARWLNPLPPAPLPLLAFEA